MILTEGCTRLHLAALRLSATGIRAELNRGADPNIRDSFGRTPLCCALARLDSGDFPFRVSWVSAIVALLDGGADLDAPRYAGGGTLRDFMPAWLCEAVEDAVVATPGVAS